MRDSGSVKFFCDFGSGATACRIRDAWRRPADLLAGLLFPPVAYGNPLSGLFRFSFGLLLGFRFQDGLGFADLLEARLPALELVRKLVAALALAVPSVFGLVGRLSFRQERFHFGRETGLGFVHALVAHRLVPGGVRLDLAPVHGNVTQLDQAGFLAQLEHLDEQARQRLEVAPAEVGDRVVVGLLVAGEHAVRDVLPGGLLDLPG